MIVVTDSFVKNLPLRVQSPSLTLISLLIRIVFSYRGEITVSLSSSPIPVVLANYDLSSISRVVNVDCGQSLHITEVIPENSSLKSAGNSSLKCEKATAKNSAETARKFINTWENTTLNRRQLHSCVCQTLEVKPLTEAKKKRIKYILRNCHSLMAKNDTLLLLAKVFTNSVAPNNLQSSSSSKWLDLAMFFMTGGRERRETEYRKLLASVGFKLTKIVDTQSSISAIEAVKVGDLRH